MVFVLRSKYSSFSNTIRNITNDFTFVENGFQPSACLLEARWRSEKPGEVILGKSH